MSTHALIAVLVSALLALPGLQAQNTQAPPAETGSSRYGLYVEANAVHERSSEELHGRCPHCGACLCPNGTEGHDPWTSDALYSEWRSKRYMERTVLFESIARELKAGGASFPETEQR